MKNQPKLPFLRTENLVVKELPEELLIYDLEKNKAFCLNETARLIMEQCDGKTSVEDAIESLNRKLKSNLTEEIVWMTIEQLKKADFIEKDFEIPLQTTKVTRRKILQSAAALGITLPIVTSLVAPTAMHAQSTCIMQNQPCTGTEDSRCCDNALCVSVPSEGPPVFACGCIQPGNPCTVGGTGCCFGAACVVGPGGPVCQGIVG